MLIYHFHSSIFSPEKLNVKYNTYFYVIPTNKTKEIFERDKKTYCPYKVSDRMFLSIIATQSPS